jgi:UDP-N-acetylmuramate--alanine ligase
MEVPPKLFFLGIGGIGMSGLARYFNQRGATVAGYDRTPSPLIEELRKEGMAVQFAEEENDIPAEFRQAPSEHVWLVRTPAVPANSPLLLYWQLRGVRVLKRSEVLGMVTRDKPTVAVAGTHGKTTVSTLLAHLLTQGGVPCNAFLGGISANYGTNVLLDPAAQVNVVEADEYDRSFLQLHPAYAAITAMDPDHLDIYGTAKAMYTAYTTFAQQVQHRVLVHEKALPLLSQHLASQHAVELEAYSVEGGGIARAVNVRVEDGAYRFDLVLPTGRQDGLMLGMPGRHNVENAVVACALALHMGARQETFRSSLASFRGVQRRFQVRYAGPRSVLVDDYAHHPAELEACISSARELYPGRHITGIFQPHLFSRTRDLAVDFARSLALLDELLLLPIYPARELPLAGITSEWLLEQVPITNKRSCKKEDLVAVLESRSVDILLALGAGDIDGCLPALEELLQRQAQ